ncbi:PTS fructose transporter subunit IIBC [Candidatus Hepatincola sp. Pdp]
MVVNMLQNLLQNNFYFHKIQQQDKLKVFKELCTVLATNSAIDNLEKFYADVLLREELSSTFIENNVAIPHAKSSSVKQVSIVLGIADSPITNNTNNNTARIFFLIAVPETQANEHLNILAELATYLGNEKFCEELLTITSKEDFLKLYEKFSNTKEATSSPEIPVNSDNTYDIVAVTACPVGIAHTYLAAEKLEKQAKLMGFSIKVQTNGSIGIKNQLTDKEIANAKYVILAVDVEVDDAPFNGKLVTKVPVAMAVHKTEELIKNTIANKVTYNATSSNSTASTVTKNPFSAYKHLLNGVSFMIPFVVIGGILIATAIAFSGVQAESGVVIHNPILKYMQDIGGMSFGLMVPILAAYIAFSIAGKPALAPAMVGGMLANSMGTGFLGGIIIGFIAGYAVKYIVKIPIHKNFAPIMAVLIVPLLGIIVVAIAMYFIGTPIASIMKSLDTSLKTMSTGSVVLAGLLGLMIATDMGGPINKVAFLFGASMIAEGIPTVMGPIAVAVAVPPLGMALASFLQPKKYLDDEKQAGKAAAIMGLIGITEGAIPFAAADPIRVIPSIMVGSAVGAMIAGYFKVADHAPHGGPIVLAVIDNRLAYCLALVVGIVITALLVNTLKKNKI